MQLRIQIAFTAVSLILGRPAFGDLFQAPHGPGGTWHVYENMNEAVPWARAQELAAARSWNDVGGTVVAINSPEENAFVEYLAYTVGQPTNWLGLTDREGAAPFDSNSHGLPAPQESGSLPDSQHQGWAWVTGETVNYVNWAPGEPRDVAFAEDAVEMRMDGRWRDTISGFAENEPVVPHLQPASSSNEVRSFVNQTFVVEYATAATSAFAGITQLTVPPKMPIELPGATGGPGYLGVTDYRLKEIDHPIQALSAQIEEIADGRRMPAALAGHFAVADLADPDARPQGGPIIDDVPLIIPSDVDGVRDTSIVSVAHGTVHVPSEGQYTIQVNTGGNFALQIGDAQFLTIGGDGFLDETDRRTMYYSGNLSSPSSRGVIELTHGDHPLRFFTSASDRGMFFEITTAQGAFPEDTGAQWLPVGSKEILAAKTLRSPVRLVEAATVANLAQTAGGETTDFATVRSIVEDAVAVGTALVRDDLASVIIQDQDGICCGRPGANLTATEQYLWPINHGASGGTNAAANYFSSLITGQLLVDDGDRINDEVVDVTFAVFASDAVQLHIDGADFVESNFFAKLDETVDGDVAMTYVSRQTSNTDMFAHIQLNEGRIYEFDAAHYDQRDDAGFEIWVATGKHLDGFDPLLFQPLSVSHQESVIPGNRGFALVATRGDFNRNGTFDAGDLDLLSTAMIANDIQFDLNRDGRTDLDDQVAWLHDLRGTWVGDANLDGEFDSDDFVDVFRAGRYATDQPASWSEGDWNGDGRFTSDDIVWSFQDGGYNVGPRAASVPEPASLALIVGSLTAFCSCRRRLTNRN